MGIIINQSIKGSFWSYAGIVVGFITTSYLFPKFLTPETVGLFGLLIAYSVLMSQFSALGFHGVTSRLFPYFRNKENAHNGYLFVAAVVIITGFILFVMVFFFVKPLLIESNIEKSALFVDYIYLLLPLTFFTLIFIQLDVFNKVLYDAVFGTFLQEFFQRVLILLITILYVFNIFNLHQLILAYAASVCFKGAFLFIYLLFKKKISFKPQLAFIDKKLRNEMISVALFSILTGLGNSIVFNIDKIIINQILGLSQTGVYTIAFFFGTLVIIPSRALLRISGTLIADAFKRKDLKYIADIYHRSCLNQFIIGAFIFGGIWINIDNILEVLGPDYEEGKWVIIIIGLAYLFDMLTGANSLVIAFSPFYKVALIFILILIVLVVGTMYLLVPEFGVVGGAVAIGISIIANNIMRYTFLKIKYGMQPFNAKFLFVLFIFAGGIGLSYFLPKLNLIVDILIRSTIFAIIFISGIYVTKASEDFNLLVKKLKENYLF